MAKEQTQAEWWEEDADRINQMSKAAHGLGVVRTVNATAPKLNPDGSLADESGAETEADLTVVANEYGIDKEELRKEYERQRQQQEE